MKRLILLFFSGMALAQTFTVSGHVVNPNTGVPTGSQITFKLINTGTQQCKVSGTGLIVPNNQVFTPDGTGTISGTLYRNDFIVCGGASNTQWSYVITAPGVTMPTCALAAVTTTSLNVDSAACTNTVPVVTPPTGDTTYCRLDGSNCGFTGNVGLNGHNITGVGAINKVIYVDQQAGATADVKFSNACTALPAGGGVLDARGFGPGNQSIAATVQCGSSTKPVAFLFDPSTVYQPSTSSVNMFQVSQNNVMRDLHIDTTNQATYSGNPISNASQGVSWWRLDNPTINMASGSTGPCVNFNSTSSSVFIDFGWVSGLQCTGGTAASGILLQNSGGGFVNSIGWSGIRIYNTKYGFDFEQAGAAAMTGHIVTDYFYEASSLATALAAVNMNATGHAGGNDLSGNIFKMQVWDLTGANKGVIVTAGSNGFACGNEFEGRLIAVTDNSTSCSLPNEFHDLSGNITNAYQIPFLNVLNNLLIGAIGNLDISNGRSLRWKNSGGTPENILNLDNTNGVNFTGDPTNKKIFFFADGSTLGATLNANLSLLLLGTGYIYDTSSTGAYRINGIDVIDPGPNVLAKLLALTPEGAAPSGQAGQEVCYGDSTLHALKCSYNNGTFFQIPQVITATSAAFATATTAGTCVQNVTAVTGATTSMAVAISPVSTPGVGAQWSAFVSSAGNVTINECAVATSAGGTIAFNIRVFP